ncbi:Alpha/Beta hydrolase protein [Xylogone sp. PMI_703]|nr:Alpha/Beta hydrolase protein [Xylogone sp. PMI_703]
MTSQTYTFDHPTLGSLTGLISPASPSSSVISFRSIPFADVPARFSQSTLLTSIPKSHSRDFTEYGTACPQVDQLTPPSPVGGLLPGEGRKYDEFSCLNLSINVPKVCLEGKVRDAPVMVYIHGGAFKEGAGNISHQHDTSAMVDLSIEEGKPMIMVAIHYRLNWFGFLACQDLLDESLACDEAPCNYGLHDQRNAFKWIKQFIPGFGGSTSQITAFGESAGSVSIAMHMSSDLPLFNRAILQSGTTATVCGGNAKEKEAEYKALLKYLQIDYNDKHRLEKLRSVPSQRLVDAINDVGIPVHRPIFDSQYEKSFFSRGEPDWWIGDQIIETCDWVEEVIIGDTFFEGWIFNGTTQLVNRDKFIDFTTTQLGQHHASKLLGAYDITPDMDPNKFWTQLMYLMGDMTFSEPTDKVARVLASSARREGAHKRKVYRYNLALRNPFPGSTYYQVPGHHFVDILFLFGTFRFRYPTQKLIDISTEFMRRWLKFGAGEQPWDEYIVGDSNNPEDEKIMIINSSVGFELRTRKEDEEKSKESEEGERRYKQWEVLREVMLQVGQQNQYIRTVWTPDGGVLKLAGVLPELSPTGNVYS